MFDKIKSISVKIKREIKVYQLIMKDKRTPKLAKILLFVAIGYVVSPIDIIPDFIPVIGQMDDLIIVPALVLAALKLIPNEVIVDCGNHTNSINEYRTLK